MRKFQSRQKAGKPADLRLQGLEYRAVALPLEERGSCAGSDHGRQAIGNRGCGQRRSLAGDRPGPRPHRCVPGDRVRRGSCDRAQPALEAAARSGTARVARLGDSVFVVDHEGWCSSGTRLPRRSRAFGPRRCAADVRRKRFRLGRRSRRSCRWRIDPARRTALRVRRLSRSRWEGASSGSRSWPWPSTTTPSTPSATRLTTVDSRTSARNSWRRSRTSSGRRSHRCTAPP